jgi:hypothetical protein
MILFFSCTTIETAPRPHAESLPPERPRPVPEVAAPSETTPPPETTSPETISPPQTAASPQASPERPERPEIPPIPERIIGQGRISLQGMSSFLLGANPEADPDYVEALVSYYIAEADMEGINHDIAFAQMCLETSFLRFGGLVTPDMNNFCGLGSIGPGNAGENFPTPQIGVRAHIQHLKAYATGEPLKQELVDPRYRWVRYGSAPTIHGLSGSWAADKQYAGKIENILTRLYGFTFSTARP